MNILKAGFIKDFIKIADDGYKMGWHECNGGNLSYRLREEDIELLKVQSRGQWTLDKYRDKGS